MQTITTKVLGATNHRPTRVKATASGSGKFVTVSWSYDGSVLMEHKRAVKKLMQKLEWCGNLTHGDIDADTKVWVFVKEITYIDWRI